MNNCFWNKANFTLFTIVKGYEAFQVHMDIVFNTFMGSTWLMTKSTCSSFFSIFRKVENLIISGCLGYSVFHFLVTIKHLPSWDFGKLVIQNKVVLCTRTGEVEITCTSCTRCFRIYQIGIVEGGLEAENQQGKPLLFILFLDNYKKGHDLLHLCHTLKCYTAKSLQVQEYQQFLFQFCATFLHSLLDQHQYNWNQ